MSIAPSAIPREALVSLLVRAEHAAEEGDDATAHALLSDLHWFSHADGRLHLAVHRLELAMARRRGDLRGAIGQLLPNAFARATSFAESLGPSHEIVRTIDAPPEAVYRAVADVGAYGEWNPWVTGAKGTAERVGDEISVDVKLGKKTMPVGHRVIVATPPERFGWYDLGWFTPLASGRRLRWIEPADPSSRSSRLVSRIQLYGPLARLAWRLHGGSIRAGMAAEAEALATRAVALASADRPATVAVPRASGNRPLAGKTCVITGPTHGIGHPTALALGELGARVLLLCRDPERGESVARAIAARGGGGSAEVIEVDLASLRSVEEAAARVRALAPRLDLLVNNAGVLGQQRRVTVDGFEEGFGVNFLAHFLLTSRLLPSLRAAPSARILHVTSNTHALARGFDFTDYNWERRRFIGIPAYAHSKLAILLFSRSLARRLAGTSVTSNALHPGVIATGMGTHTLGKTVNDLARALFLTPEEGAMTSIFVATSPSVAACQGEYFVDSRIARPSRWAQDDVAAERLFHFAEALLAERGYALEQAA